MQTTSKINKFTQNERRQWLISEGYNSCHNNVSRPKTLVGLNPVFLCGTYTFLPATRVFMNLDEGVRQHYLHETYMTFALA